MRSVPARISTASAVFAATVLACAPAFGAPILSPVSTQTIVDASAVNGALATRLTTSDGPLSDSISHAFGTNLAESAAAIDGWGLHADAVLFNDMGAGLTGSARAIPSIVNPFMLVPQAGFGGTHALVQFQFRLTGSVADTDDCESCFSAIQVRMEVDGFGESLFYLATRSDGTKGNPDYINGPIDKTGVLTGLLPVNTELFLRTSLLSQTHCQSFDGAPCATDVEADFWYSGVSGDAVDFVWGLTPIEPDVPAVPEPASAALLGLGLLVVARRLKSRR